MGAYAGSPAVSVALCGLLRWTRGAALFYRKNSCGGLDKRRSAIPPVAPLARVARAHNAHLGAGIGTRERTFSATKRCHTAAETAGYCGFPLDAASASDAAGEARGAKRGRCVDREGR